MKPRTVGAWVVSHAIKLNKVNTQGDFDNISSAGKFGILLSVLSASDEQQLSKAKLKALAKANGISPQMELPGLLARMHERHLITPTDEGESLQESESFQLLGITHGSVLEKVADLFDELGPEPEELAAITIAEDVSAAPIRTTDLSAMVSDTFKMTKGRTRDFLGQAELIGFVDAEDLDTTQTDKLYFNGNIFRIDDAQKTMKVLQSLKEVEQTKVREFDDLLSARGFATVDEARAILGEKLFEKLQAIAMFDVSRVANAQEEVHYVTRPASFAKYGNPWEEDTLDYAKALVASLAYGMTRRQQGMAKIELLARLLQKLIRGDWLGANKAAGEDYRYLELKNIVETKPYLDWNGYFTMRLLKKEVGVVALEVLTQGKGSAEGVLEKLPEAPVTSYFGPEENRVNVRKKRPIGQTDRKLADLLQSIRTGRI